VLPVAGLVQVGATTRAQRASTEVRAHKVEHRRSSKEVILRAAIDLPILALIVTEPHPTGLAVRAIKPNAGSASTGGLQSTPPEGDTGALLLQKT